MNVRRRNYKGLVEAKSIARVAYLSELTKGLGVSGVNIDQTNILLYLEERRG